MSLVFSRVYLCDAVTLCRDYDRQRNLKRTVFVTFIIRLGQRLTLTTRRHDVRHCDREKIRGDFKVLDANWLHFARGALFWPLLHGEPVEHVAFGRPARVEMRHGTTRMQPNMQQPILANVPCQILQSSGDDKMHHLKMICHTIIKINF